MLCSVRNFYEFSRYKVRSLDGDAGRCDDFLFCTKNWSVRWIVVNIGSWLHKKRVVISPKDVENVDLDQKQINLKLNSDQLHSAEIFTDPASRDLLAEDPSDFFLEHAIHFDINKFTGSYGMPFPEMSYVDVPRPLSPPQEPLMHSTRELKGFSMAFKATDESFGEVEDLIMEIGPSWTLRSLVVSLDSEAWAESEFYMVDPEDITSIDWPTRLMLLEKGKDGERHPFVPYVSVNRGTDGRFFDYYGRPVAWTFHRALHPLR